MIDYKEIGNRIKTLRLNKGLTQENMALLAGISVSFYGHVERGARKASIETIVTLAHILGVSVGFILDNLYE